MIRRKGRENRSRTSSNSGLSGDELDMPVINVDSKRIDVTVSAHRVVLVDSGGSSASTQLRNREQLSPKSKRNPGAEVTLLGIVHITSLT